MPGYLYLMYWSVTPRNVDLLVTTPDALLPSCYCAFALLIINDDGNNNYIKHETWVFLTEDGGFPLMASLGYGVPLRTKLYLGRLRPKREQRKKKDFMLLAMSKRHYFNFSEWCKKGGTFLQKMFNKKCKEQNLAAERCVVKQRQNG